MAAVFSASQAALHSRIASGSCAAPSQKPLRSSFAGSLEGLKAGDVQKKSVSRRGGVQASISPKDDVPGGRFIPATHKHLYEGIEKMGKDVTNVTYYPTLADTLNESKKWYIVDARDKVLGRLACAVALKLRGKDNPIFTPSMNVGSYVIVTNADKVVVSGKKSTQKLYRRHSGRPGGMTVETFHQLQQRVPERIVEKAVKGMLPKGILGRELFRHLKVYAGPAHPHEAQQPEELVLADPMAIRVKATA